MDVYGTSYIGGNERKLPLKVRARYQLSLPSPPNLFPILSEFVSHPLQLCHPSHKKFSFFE
jgi:hypothetical protein